ncbi:DUF3883 domain-containing protein [Congregibacter litoralis]|uniref:Protein NO VEIN C-terminal domain-containing protein n=1 Tax=Congregibacter litoralis KT71 TaxID=314285 RepID=A4AB33_9GAMM|nr:DUF3883 domain-containing protein [Congregibacter litoralis]EAQ96905.2 Domain protein of unknown function [Congregibacter litoralis KT71]
MSLIAYQNEFATLRLSVAGGRPRPHKVAMLLAVIDLIAEGYLDDNRIYYDDELVAAFSRNFNALAQGNDTNNPFLPFFHLRSAEFWHHQVRPSAAEEYESLTTATSAGVIGKTISFAYLDDELFEILAFEVPRKLLRESLLRNLSRSDVDQLIDVNGWSWFECEVLVADYFKMLTAELIGDSYNKTKHRDVLLKLLPSRSKGSVEFKHQNVSAVLVDLGQPYIKGYKPRFNYQDQLVAVVKAHLAARGEEMERQFESLADHLPGPYEIDWARVLDPELPKRGSEVREVCRTYTARKVNYAAKESANRRLGERGEEFALEYERYRLGASLRADLADRVEWSSKVLGDGLGFDIRSFDSETENERFIEVKTTNSGKYLPFFVSANELTFSQERSAEYALYRVFDFSANARLFELKGAIDRHVHLEPTVFRARFE